VSTAKMPSGCAMIVGFGMVCERYQTDTKPKRQVAAPPSGTGRLH
jgi:hypothetical protein